MIHIHTKMLAYFQNIKLKTKNVRNCFIFKYKLDNFLILAALHYVLLFKIEKKSGCRLRIP